jgi:hypothetical protein
MRSTWNPKTSSVVADVADRTPQAICCGITSGLPAIQNFSKHRACRTWARLVLVIAPVDRPACHEGAARDRSSTRAMFSSLEAGRLMLHRTARRHGVVGRGSGLIGETWKCTFQMRDVGNAILRLGEMGLPARDTSRGGRLRPHQHHSC